MDSRELMEFASGKSIFRILRILHDTPMYAGNIAKQIHSDIRTVRTLLHRLKKRNFVVYEKVGRRHVYHIKTPFETPMHETIMGFVSMAPPIEEGAEPDREPLDPTDPHPLLVEAQRDYWTTLIKGFFTALLNQGSIAQAERTERKLEEIRRRIERYKNI